MRIAHYSYDTVTNPLCGGGGAFREKMVHRELTSFEHPPQITLFCGNHKGAINRIEEGILIRHLGFATPYILSRITYSIAATLHSIFVSADVIVIAYSVFSPVLGFILRKKRCVLLFYHLTGHEPFRKYSIFGIFPWIAEKIALGFGRNFTTLTDSMANYITSHYKGKYVKATYTGYEESMLSQNRYDDGYILYFGRIDIHMKGIDLLIDAFESISSNFPETRLVLAGRGNPTDVSWLKNRIARSPRSGKISFAENVSTEEKKNLFYHATFVCMPSRFEGWCISAIEAAACSKATIGTSIMGLQDSIRDGQTGLLVESQNAQALGQAMVKLLSDHPLRKFLGENGHRWAQNFTWKKVAALEYSVYENIVSSPGRKHT